MVKLLSISGELHLKSCGLHTNAKRNVPDLSRRTPERNKFLPRGLVTRQMVLRWNDASLGVRPELPIQKFPSEFL